MKKKLNIVDILLGVFILVSYLFPNLITPFSALFISIVIIGFYLTEVSLKLRVSVIVVLGFITMLFLGHSPINYLDLSSRGIRLGVGSVMIFFTIVLLCIVITYLVNLIINHFCKLKSDD